MTAPSPSSGAEKLEELLRQAQDTAQTLRLKNGSDYWPADVLAELAAACRGLRDERDNFQADSINDQRARMAYRERVEALSRENAEQRKVAGAAIGYLLNVLRAALAPKETGK